MLTPGDGVKVVTKSRTAFGEVIAVKYKLDCAGKPWLMDEVTVEFHQPSPILTWIFTGDYIKQLILVRESTIEGDKQRKAAKHDR